MTQEQEELKQQNEIAEIAALRGNRGFQLLIQRFRDLEQEHLQVMKVAKSSQDALSALRFWQIFSQIIDRLESEPEDAAAYISTLRQDFEDAGQDPTLDPIFQFGLRRHIAQVEPPQELE